MVPPSPGSDRRGERDRLLDELAGWLDVAYGEGQARGAPFDVRAEVVDRLRLSYSEQGITSLGESQLAGGAVRVWAGGTPGFTATTDLSAESARSTIERAGDLAQSSAARGDSDLPYRAAEPGSHVYEPAVREDPTEIDPHALADLLRVVYEGATDAGAAPLARATLDVVSRGVLYKDVSGCELRTGFLMTTLMCHAIHKGPGRTGEGADAMGGEWGLKELVAHEDPSEVGARVFSYAKESAQARPAPAGTHRVLCDGHLAGVLAHESFGHLIEADVVSSGWSLLRGRLGETFAPETVGVTDAPAPPEGCAQGLVLPYDEEGTRGRDIRILEGGVLRSWLHSRASAESEGHTPTGNGRAIHFRFPPIVRMRNTYFEPGDLSVEESLELLGDGIYLIGSRGGAPASDGSFLFAAQRGYLVRGGELQEPLREAAIAGNILDFLSGVEGLSKELSIRAGAIGGCSKAGQAPLPVAVGGPHVLVSSAMVAGGGA